MSALKWGVLAAALIVVSNGCGAPTPAHVTFTSPAPDKIQQTVAKFIKAARAGDATAIVELAEPALRAEQRAVATDLVAHQRQAFDGKITVTIREGENSGIQTACLHLEQDNTWIYAYLFRPQGPEWFGLFGKWTLDHFEIEPKPCA